MLRDQLPTAWSALIVIMYSFVCYLCVFSTSYNVELQPKPLLHYWCQNAYNNQITKTDQYIDPYNNPHEIMGNVHLWMILVVRFFNRNQTVDFYSYQCVFLWKCTLCRIFIYNSNRGELTTTISRDVSDNRYTTCIHSFEKNITWNELI